MEYEVVKNVLLLLVGAAIALLSNWVMAWIERETAASKEVFNLRVNGLNDIWVTFIAVKDIYAAKVPKGHEPWLKEYKEEAQQKLNQFRHLVDANQVVLPKPIIDKLREIDSYMNSLLDSDSQKPAQYVDDINTRLVALSVEANKCFQKRTHAINLSFRT